MNTRGFTLPELMIVVLVLSISAMVVVPLTRSDEATDIGAAAELLAADIEEVQARNLADPRQPTSLVPSEQRDGWHLAWSEAPEQPIPGIDGTLRARCFGVGALASAGSLTLELPELPADGLRFDDQGAPLTQDTRLLFKILGTETAHAAEVTLSPATGRVSIAMVLEE